MDDEVISSPIDGTGNRPAMLLGMPITLAVPLATGIAWVAAVFGFWVILTIPIWYALSHLVRKDYNAGAVFVIWARTAALDMQARTWGGTSVNPEPLKPFSHLRGMQDAI